MIRITNPRTRASALLALVAFSTAAPPSLAAPEGLKVSGSSRSRYEWLEGQARPGLGNPEQLVSLRTTLHLEYAVSRFHFGAEMYDSRAYFDDARTGIAPTT